MNKVVISIGSNSNDRQCQMEKGISWIKEYLSNVVCSNVYNTQAINGVDKDYLNAVAVGYYNGNLDTLIQELKQYEIACGRTIESKRVGVVPMDIDVVMTNGSVVRQRDYNQDYFQIGWSQLEQKKVL